MLERRLLKNIDFSLLLGVLLVNAISLVFIGSATRHTPIGGDPLYYVKKQLVWQAVGLVMMVLTMSIDYSLLSRLARIIYAGNLGLLAAVLMAGRSALGAQRWIAIGPFELQPSEFAKIALIISLAAYLAGRERPIKRPLDYAGAFIHIVFPLALVMRQPDLGTSLVFLAILFGMLLIYGAPLCQLAIMVVGGLSVAIGAVMAHLKFGLPLPLKGYQLNRLIVFANPNIDPLGIGYHIIQSMIAIGSGRFFGRGIFAGTQNKLNFLPEQHTDFIFSVIGEESGYIGALLVLGLYLLILYRGLKITLEAKDRFGSLVAAGVVSMWTFHILVNVGMTTGIMPVTGIPLPFMSYGGSALIANMIALGLLLNIHMRRHKILF
ncbi:MAG: rod shape-determining protein RodA [Bacillota bacterium]